MPAFRDSLAGRLTYPLSWLSGQYTNFDHWREAARARVRECLLAAPPPAPFKPVVLAEEDRGSYVARKVVLNLTGDSRVLALMTVPKGQGPFPAVLLLHDHGAKFDIGKELAIVLGGEVVTTHTIRAAIKGGEVQITSCAAGAAKYLLEQLREHQKGK